MDSDSDSSDSDFDFPSEANPKISFNTDFCVQLAYNAFQKKIEKGSNFLCSPLSIHIILSLLAAGSAGETLEQLLSFLGSEGKDDLNSASSRIISSLRDVEGSENNGGPALSFVNGAWVEKTCRLDPSFEEIVKNIYKSQFEEVDFINKADEVVEQVNSWVQNATRGLIRDLLAPGSLDEQTKIVMANSLYFKGAWHQKFDPAMTRTRSFNLFNGEKVQVPFMTSMEDEKYYYRSFENYKLLKIPYRSGSSPLRFSMYFFLPHDKHGLPNLVHTLNSNPSFLNQKFQLWQEEFSEFWIPRFKFSFDLDPVEDMKELGLTLPFVPTGKVSSIVHKAFVEVNEEGTEAAAATSLIWCFSLGSSPPGRPKQTFVAEHPFMFMIREETSMAVFFIGAVLNPFLGS